MGDGSVGITKIRAHGTGIERFTADGVHDTRPVYEALAAVAGAGARVVIPPRKEATGSASGDDVLRQRESAIARIAEVGRRQWRKESGAHR